MNTETHFESGNSPPTNCTMCNLPWDECTCILSPAPLPTEPFESLWGNDGERPSPALFKAIWAQALLSAAGFLSKYGNNKGIPYNERSICGQTREDLAEAAGTHVVMQIIAGKLRRVPVAERERYIKTMLWHKMSDIVSRHSNSRELQSPTMRDVNTGEVLDSDEALIVVANDRLEVLEVGELSASLLRGSVIRRREIRELEEFVSDILQLLPASMSSLIKARFGFLRDDEMGSESPHYIDPMTLDQIVDMQDYGSNVVAVHRRIQEALERLEVLIVAEWRRQRHPIY